MTLMHQNKTLLKYFFHYIVFLYGVARKKEKKEAMSSLCDRKGKAKKVNLNKDAQDAL